MNSKHPGCLSASGLLAAAITLLLVGAISLVRGGRLFSPGPLNAQEGGAALGGVSSHDDLGGRCAACHTPFWTAETMSARCLDCHESVRAELDARDSLHGVLAAGILEFDCRDCHTEHEGPAGSLTSLDLVEFPHEAFGFSLAAHSRLFEGREFECRDCHIDRLSEFPPRRCLECHTDLDEAFLTAHSGVFGDACLDCHDGVDSFGAAFTHDLTGFPLVGEHASLGCETCHAGAADLPALQETPAECYTCHAADDAHGGEFGTGCGACHTPESWEGASIDHDLTGFPLVGEHAEVACEDCHAGGVFAGTPHECIDCHAADDAHGGEFGTECGACHTPESWEDASIDHDLTGFPLTGAHSEVACTDCHRDGIFRGTPVQCAACHAEPAYHQGLFSTECESCHSTAAWRPADFDLPHPFPFNHGDQINSCTTCHPTVLQSYTCYACHEHEPAEIAEEHLDEGISDFQDCARCHPTGLEDEGD